MQMHVLAFDHFFGQDLAALREALSAGDRLTEIRYQRVRRPARRVLPEVAFAGLETPYDGDEFTNALPAMNEVGRRIADWLAGVHHPDVFVTPSDSFFYLRPVIERFRALGIPTVVVQKETTISPMTMAEHSIAVGRTTPFMSDAMTVCSERQAEFWIRAGCDPRLITVTGQPRFDVYGRGRPPAEPPSVLFLSYMDDAYLTSGSEVRLAGNWKDQRLATERVLAQIAAGGTPVRVKRHPQQQASEEALGGAVTRAAQTADTRELILEATVVVGFQTTALFEAAAAGRQCIYAAWGEPFTSVREHLIPFHTYDQVVTHATSPAHLAELLAAPASVPLATSDGVRIAEHHLGPLDGLASERVWAVLRDVAATGAPEWPKPSWAEIGRRAWTLPFVVSRFVAASRRPAAVDDVVQQAQEVTSAVAHRTLRGRESHRRSR